MGKRTHSSRTQQKDQRKEKDQIVQSVSIFALADRLKSFGASFAAVIGVAYALGFLITNIYLGTKYNIYDFSLIKTRYVYTGFIFLLLLFMAFLGAYALFRIWEQQSESSKWVKWGIVIFAFLGISSIWSLSLKGLLSIIQGNRFDAFFEFPISHWFRLAIPLMAMEIWVFKQKQEGKYLFPFPLTSSIFTGAIILAAVYSLQYYGLLPFSIGGGMPIPVKIVVAEEETDLVGQIVPLESENISELVYLLDKSPNSYFILVSDTNSTVHAIELDKTLVAGIIHPQETNKPFVSPNLLGTPAIAVPTGTQITPTVTNFKTKTPSP